MLLEGLTSGDEIGPGTGANTVKTPGRTRRRAQCEYVYVMT